MAMPGRALPPVPCGEVDFLLPTGLMMTLNATPTTSLRQLKDRLFQEAKQYPLFSMLKDQGFYNLLGITRDGEGEEFVNEERCLEDLNLYAPVLKLVERKGNQKEKQLNAQITDLIGRRTCMHDFDTMGTEAQDFRRSALAVSEQAVAERAESQAAAMRYYYPPNLLDYQPRVDTEDNEISVSVDYLSSDGTSYRTVIQVDLVNDPRSVLELALTSREFLPVASRLDANSFVLKVVGKEEYFLKEVPIIQYKYVSSCQAKKVQPRFSLKLYDDLRPKEKEEFIRPVYAGQQQDVPALYGTRTRSTSCKQSSEFVSVMEVQDTYKIKVLSAKNANTPENLKVYVKAGIYHGRESLCSVVTTSKAAASEGTEWNEILEFDISIRDLPRGAKLCFIVFAAPERGKNRRKKTVFPLAWVNMMVFDYEGRLQTGKQELYAWPCGSELEGEVNFMGSNVLNLSTSEDVSVEIEVIEPRRGGGVPGKPIMYPTEEQLNKFAQEMSLVSIPAAMFKKSNPKDVKSLQKVIEGDPLSQLDEQDKELIWRARNVCLNDYPQSLPKLLQSLCWNNRSEVAQVYLLLQKWRSLTPETVLELLDHQYADIQVRDRAVEWLECLGDNQLIMYLLQLVQALKFEPYLDCALGQFLLRRALQNKVIGHFLFWHLRSEMHLPHVWVRYGLMLEAYCRGCGNYRFELIAQVQALNKMTQVTNDFQLQKKKSDELLRVLRQKEFKSVMETVSSPLDPSLRFKQLNDNKCKVMDSKMRPLWLVFNNQDMLGDDIFHIFKNGDDLRQDMLTLQIIGIMDSQWKADGLNLRMTPYGCLSTGDQVGLIEVILNSSTIAKIQKKSRGARGAFDRTLLLKWLREQNPKPAELDKAIGNFTLSCAGYCVATYVLGIGDRHSDNIMICKNGQLAHIDFGHFLGNFKSKFGVKRERVPFVLTDDFIYIITNGGDRTSSQFTRFKLICEDAFMKLRNHGSLFINLFSLMLSCEIPELTTPNDINYIRDALCLSMSEDQALENFRKKMKEAVGNAWSVSMNWYFHNVKRAGN